MISSSQFKYDKTKLKEVFMKTINIKILTICFIFILIVIMVSSAIAADGFGGNATGGAGGTAITITNASNFTTYATSSSPYIITVSGTITLTGNVLVKSNKTIQGADGNATISGDLKLGSGVSNVIIQYLNITNPTGVGDKDGITILDSAKRVFITHCTFTDCADGMCDITVKADSITVSWCKFRYVSQTAHKYVNLIGANDAHTSDLGRLHVTFHHNWYDQNCNERMPSVRFGRVHVYNNYYDSDSALYCVRTRLYAECLVENNYFERVQNPWELALSIKPGTITGKVHAANNNVSFMDTTYGVRWMEKTYEDTLIVTTLIPGTDTVFIPSYSYTPDNALDIKSKVTASAGNVFTPYTITATAGANGSITPSGVTYVSQGSNLTYTITPATGYNVADVLVDGGSVGAVTSFTFTNIITDHTISASFTRILSTGWNLVSVSRVASNYNARSLFPNKTGSMYAYNTELRNYQAAPVLSNGPGYWLNNSRTDTVVFSGSAPGSLADTAARAGWVLIGSRDTTVQVSSLILSDGAMRVGGVFRYDAAAGIYQETTVIDPGEAVWINVDKACTITIP